jgi:hypothetical protein
MSSCSWLRILAGGVLLVSASTVSPSQAAAQEMSKLEKRAAAFTDSASADSIARIAKAEHWSAATWSHIRNHQVAIGMTWLQVRLSRGSPLEINTTKTKAHVREQWVYGIGEYVYFTDGKVTAIQSSSR